MRYQSIKYVVSVCSLLAVLAWPAVSRAQIEPQMLTPDPNLPPLNSVYISPDQWHAYYAAGIYLGDIRHSGFTDEFPPPPPGGNASHTFGSLVEGSVSFDGVNFSPFSVPATVTVYIASGIDVGSIRWFDTEMTALNASGGSLPPGVMIRESPTLHSTGQTSIVDYGNGTYCVGSYFDIYTELSLDGGMTWMPDLLGPAHMAIVPEPSCLMLLGLGALALAIRRFKCRK